MIAELMASQLDYQKLCTLILLRNEMFWRIYSNLQIVDGWREKIHYRYISLGVWLFGMSSSVVGWDEWRDWSFSPIPSKCLLQIYRSKTLPQLSDCQMMLWLISNKMMRLEKDSQLLIICNVSSVVMLC